jgi:hypothetical protein
MGFRQAEPLPFGENGGGADKGSARRAHKPQARSLGNRAPCPRRGQSPVKFVFLGLFCDDFNSHATQFESLNTAPFAGLSLTLSNFPKI